MYASVPVAAPGVLNCIASCVSVASPSVPSFVSFGVSRVQRVGNLDSQIEQNICLDGLSSTRNL
jgi:hypothetical protein